MSARPPKTENLVLLVRFVRGERVLLDSDLADLYGVRTKVLNQAVKRNIERFPEDFMFQLNAEEWARLREKMESSRKGPPPMRSKIVTASRRNVGAHPYASPNKALRCSPAFCVPRARSR